MNIAVALANLAADRAHDAYKEIVREARLRQAPSRTRKQIVKNCFRLEYLLFCVELSDLGGPNGPEIVQRFLVPFAERYAKAVRTKRDVAKIIKSFCELSKEANGKALYAENKDEVADSVIGILAGQCSPRSGNVDHDADVVLNILLTLLEIAQTELQPSERNYADVLVRHIKSNHRHDYKTAP